MTNIEFHLIADLFPLLQGAEFDAFKDDIATHGLKHPITLYDGKILDGRNRYRACLDAGIEPRFEKYSGDDPVTYAASMNLSRRHLTASQKATVWHPYFIP